MKYYIASCVFTAKYPALSKRITDYVSFFPDIKIIRCCTPGWKVGIYEEKMPEDGFRDHWKSLTHTADFLPGDETYSLCANCSNIIEKSRFRTAGVRATARKPMTPSGASSEK